MQITLVSHYGQKPAELASYLKRCQAELTRLLPSAFSPYDAAQVHGTIIGLEGCRRADEIENTNYRELRQEIRTMDPREILGFLQSHSFPSIDVRIGGYAASTDYGFLSQGEHPHARSFSIQGPIAVGMGWPADRSNSLDELRRSFSKLNALHKWHGMESDVDNDFFFVLGRIDRESITCAENADAVLVMREFVASSDPVTVTINRSSLRLVCYSDAQLPLIGSHAHAICDPTLTPERLLSYYPQ